MSAFVIGRENEGDRIYAIELLELRLGDASAAACLKPVAAVNERAFIIQNDGVEQLAGFDIEGEPFT